MRKQILLPLLIAILLPCSLYAIPNTDLSLDEMGIREMVGQLMVVGFDGTVPNAELRELVEYMRIGGVILFSRNIENPDQIHNLTQYMQSANMSRVPMLIATDEEGGRVIRLYRDLTMMPSPMAIAATGSPLLAYAAGKLTAARLSSIGITANLAPVLDVGGNIENRAMRNRTFGENPVLVGTLGAAYIKGMQSLGVSATAKHFPGHGKTGLDSHKTLPKIYSTEETIKNFDLIPFKKAIEENVDIIMTAHVAYPKIDTTGMPATLSTVFIKKILREQLKYDGVIMTDDLEMNAIKKTMNIGDAAVQAIVAGCDMVLVGGDFKKQRAVFDALLHAVQSGKISEDRLKEALGRVYALKKSRAHLVANRAWQNKLKDYLKNGWQSDLADIITKQSATLVTNHNAILPLSLEKKKTLVVSPMYELYREINRRGGNVEYIEVPLLPSALEKKNITDKVVKLAAQSGSVDQLIIGVINRHHAELVFDIKNKVDQPVVVVSFDSPQYLSKFPDVDAFLSVYHYRTGAAEIAARAILGDIPVIGRLPVSVTNRPVGFGEEMNASDPFVMSN